MELDFNSELVRIITEKTGLELYKELFVLHMNARTAGQPITYPDSDPRTGTGFTNKVLDITVYGDDPGDLDNWKRRAIPLSCETDFKGWTFRVSTSQLTESRSLFYLGQDRDNVILLEGENAIGIESIDSGHFHNNPILKTGKHLVVIEDKTPWTYRQELLTGTPTPWSNWNYNNSYERRDVLLVIDGIALNRPISPYSTMQSNPECRYVTLDNFKHVMKNVNMVRTSNCEQVINLVTIQNIDDVTVENVTVTTPDNSTLVLDSCINVYNATNINVKQFSMNKTYSRETANINDYGYGISMENVWNSVFKQVESNYSVWGFFGCRHVNTAYLENCSLNRFDIHCYGRDITCVNCVFAPNPNTYNTTGFCNNRFASLIGNLIYKGCTFDNFIPYFTDYNYNVYQGFDVLFKNCTFNVVKSANAHLIELGYWGEPLNYRKEHIHKCAPNVALEDCTIRLGNGISEVYLFYLRDTQAFAESIHYVSYISVINLTLKDASDNVLPFSCFKEINKSVTYANTVYRFKDRNLNGSF